MSDYTIRSFKLADGEWIGEWSNTQGVVLLRVKPRIKLMEFMVKLRGEPPAGSYIQVRAWFMGLSTSEEEDQQGS